MKKPSVLLVDPDIEFLEGFIKAKSSLIDIQIASERKNAQLKIADKSTFLAAIILNTKTCKPHSIPLIRFAKSHRPATPIFLLADTADAVPPETILEDLHIKQVLNKPIDRNTLFNAVFPYTYFELEKTLEIAAKDTTGIDSTHSAQDEEMHAIRAVDFLCGSSSYFDVFVRLSSGKYIKLLKAGDKFDLARVKNYLEKGVEFFYIKKEAQEFFLQYCDKITEAVLGAGSLSESVKISQVVNFGKETSDFLKSRGFNEMTLQSANQYVKHARTLIEDLQPHKNSLLNSFLQKSALCDHGTGTVMLLSLFLDALEYRDSKVLDVIALGGFLHDIGMMNMPEHFWDEDEDKLQPEERLLYEKHPTQGAEMLATIRMINPLIPQVVQQHHERRSRHGFPFKLGPGAISPVSELVGMTETFNRYIKLADKNPKIDPVEEMKRKHFDDFSFQVIEAFRKVFLKPHKLKESG